MEIFRTLVSPPSSPLKIDYSSNIMFLGSCFSEYIANKLLDFKFKIDNNPFGIVYNPLSICSQLEKLTEGTEYTADQLFYNEGLWCSFDHHGRFSDPDKNSCLTNINQQLQNSRQFLQSADFLFLTFGTSFVYFVKDSNQSVANCHKVPAEKFTRKRVSVQKIVHACEITLEKLRVINPNLCIVFTVSPIRHWKDGAHENQLSKATLLLAIEELRFRYPNSLYFPSYEMIMDDLRDYRFYAEDMLHPNLLAVNYIWRSFVECFMLPETLSIMKDVEKVVQASKHRPFNPNTKEFQTFVQQSLGKIESLKKRYNIICDKEEQYFRSLLSEI
jgi:hypothetical protein